MRIPEESEELSCERSEAYSYEDVKVVLKHLVDVVEFRSVAPSTLLRAAKDQLDSIPILHTIGKRR